MNSQITAAAATFIKLCLFVTCCALGAASARAEWTVDLSRRHKAVRDGELNAAASPIADERAPASDGAGLVDRAARAVESILDVNGGGEPQQELVVLNTERGFVPSVLRLRNGGRYVVHVVNVNEKEKNVSFVLDAFGEHHATYYGKIKTFRADPKKEGVYSFQCPETGSEGRLVVYAPSGSGAPPAQAMPAPVQLRAPASVSGIGSPDVDAGLRP